MQQRGRKSKMQREAIAAVVDASGDDVAEIINKQQQPPAHLNAAARAWWSAIVRDFELQPHQLRTLQAAAESWDRYQQARQALAEHGLTYTDPKGMVRARPECAIERDSRIAYLRAMRELNLTIEPPSWNRGGGIGITLEQLRDR